MSDCHLPDEKLCKSQCGLVLYGERTAASGHILPTTLSPVLLTLFLCALEGRDLIFCMLCDSGEYVAKGSAITGI